jgi:hypothetical protein
MFTATVFITGEKPVASGDIVLRGRNDAMHWCYDNARNGYDMFVILENGVVVKSGEVSTLPVL